MMRRVSTAFLMLFMFTFLGLGFCGLAQHIGSQVIAGAASIERGR